MSATICCPGCGLRVASDAIVCRDCMEFLPQSLRNHVESVPIHGETLLTAVLPAVWHALERKPAPAKGRAGAPKIGGTPCRGMP